MSDHTNIAWTDATWSPVRGCSRVSAGCEHCYAERMAARFAKAGEPYAGTIRDGHWSGKVRLVPEALAQPLRWRKPRRVFVCSMSDLFHEAVPSEYIAAVFGVMATTPRHTFQVLTKRPERMRAWFAWAARLPLHDSHSTRLGAPVIGYIYEHTSQATSGTVNGFRQLFPEWPLPNVWLGVSAENQAAADERIPILLDTPAAVRFVSCEPMIGPVVLRCQGCCYPIAECKRGQAAPDAGGCSGWWPDWVIAGGESGPGARSCDVAWLRAIVAQCRGARVPCFVKQLGANPIPLKPTRSPSWNATTGRPFRGWLNDEPYAISDPSGGDLLEWPPDLRVQEWPR